MNDPEKLDDIQHVPSSTPNFQTELAHKLSELVPEAIADGKVDTKKLQELLEGDTADESERFGLFWPGKKRAMRAAQEPTTATLKPVKEESKDWDTTQNLFIEGDNLEVLKILQKHYHNKIKMIYIDPPYNTGKDFVYPDNFKEGLQTYLEFTKQVDEQGKKLSTNSDTDGRYHSNWLNMMYPRLKLARNLLTDDGVIFISIDDHEQAHLRKICDEVFGEENFVGIFKWNKTSKAPTLSKLIRNKYEYLLLYKRKYLDGLRGQSSYNTMAPLLNGTNNYNELTFTAGMIRLYFPDGVYQKGQYGKSSSQVELLDDLVVENGKNKFPVNIRARFKWTQQTLNARFESNQSFAFKKPNFMTMYYTLDNEDGNKFIAPSDIINDEEAGVLRNDEAYSELNNLMGDLNVFDYTKPVSLIKYLANMQLTDDFIVMDFFSGSGTTAHAVMQLNAEDRGNRKHIQVQLPEPTDEISEAHKAGYNTISEIAKERIRRAGEKIKADFAGKLSERENSLDTGFRVYKLADTNFSKWQTSSDVSVDAVQQRLLDMRESSNDAATQEDLLTEVLLKLGLSLTGKAQPKDIAGLNVWDVPDGAILAYMDEHTKPTLDQLRALAESEPAKLVILEDVFQGDDELKTNLAQICKTNKIEIWTV